MSELHERLADLSERVNKLPTLEEVARIHGVADLLSEPGPRRRPPPTWCTSRDAEHLRGPSILLLSALRVVHLPSPWFAPNAKDLALRRRTATPR